MNRAHPNTPHGGARSPATAFATSRVAIYLALAAIFIDFLIK